MFTPHGKGWTGLSPPALAPADQQIGSAAVASLTCGKGRIVSERITELEKEIHQYQHNMGLLLIEKKEWAAKYDQFCQEFAENEEILKREKAAHLNAISEYEKRAQSIRKALYVEKQGVADLEKAVREMRSEIAGVKSLSEKKIVDVNSLQANIDERSFLIDKKLNAADAKLAEANLTVSHADKKIKDIEPHQDRYEKEKLCYETEWKAQENQLKEKEEYLHDWKKRLVNLQRSLSSREENLIANDRIFKMEHEELQKTKLAVENSNAALKVEEYGINNKLKELHAYEMAIKSKYKTLEKKEEILDDWEGRINMKEKGLHKIIEDNKAGLESKTQDFDLVMKRERESLLEEMQKRSTNLQWREKDVKSKEDNLLKRDQELNWNTEMLDAWKNDLDSRSQDLKKLEETLKIEDQKMEESKLRLKNERKDIDMYKLDLERTMSSGEAGKQSILEEQEILKLTKEERDAHAMTLVKLKQEIEECRVESNSLSKEADDLRHQKLKLERAWEELDMKKAYTEEAAKKHSYERTGIERFHDSEKRRLKDVELEMRANHKKQMENIRLKEEACMCDIEQQKFQNTQLLEGERANIQRSFDLRRLKLETETEQKQMNKEQELELTQNELNKKLDLVENEITSAVALNGSKIQKIIFEKKELENEKTALVNDQQKLETDKADIKEDLDRLNILSKRLKEGREAYRKEKNHLIGLIDKYKVCKTCRVSVLDELDVPGIKDSTRLDKEASEHEDDYGHSRIYEVANDSFAFSQETPSDSRAGETEEVERISFGESGSFSFGVADDLQSQSGDTNNGMEFDANIALNDGSGNESSDTPKGAMQPNQGEHEQKRDGRQRGVKRTRTMRAVIEEAKMLIGPISEEKHNDEKDCNAASAGNTEQFVENSIGVYSDGDPSEGPSRKRRQLGGTAMQVPGENRYNLRRNRVVNAATSSNTRSGKTRGAMKPGSKRKIEASSGDDAKGASTGGVPATQMSTEIGKEKARESSRMFRQTEARSPVGNRSKNVGGAVNGQAAVPDCVPSDSDLVAEDGDEDDQGSPTENGSVGRKLRTFFHS